MVNFVYETVKETHIIIIIRRKKNKTKFIGNALEKILNNK